MTRSRGLAGRRWLLPILLLLGAAGAGYLATLLVVPAPLPGALLPVPSLRGMAQVEATERLDSLGFRLRLGGELPDHNVASGLVAWQSPVAGTMLPPGALVQVGLSSGNPLLFVPDLEGLALPQAIRILAAAGLAGGRIDSTDAGEDPGTVITTNPKPGATLRGGSKVDIIVSRSPQLVLVPMLIGLPVERARESLTAAGLKVGQFSVATDGRPGRVLRQQPAAGSSITRGGQVDLTIGGDNR